MMDPAQLQVLISQLTGVAEEMGSVLRRSAFSPNIKERADCSAALFTPEGELLVQAEHIPVHLGSMPASVAAAIAVGIEPEGGQQIVLNDPFAGGTHLNDITLVAPCLVGGRLAGWVANRAHHADVGGMAPGSIPPAATSIYQEGLRIPPVVLTPGVAAILQANSRTPRERRADLDAQVGANVVGLGRLAALADRPLHEVVAYGERRMRAALAELPDGCWEVADVLDSTGPGGGPVTIRLVVEIIGDEVRFDFTGTAAQQPGNVQRGRCGDVERGGVGVAFGHRSVHPGQWRRHAPGTGGPAPRQRGRRRGPGGGRGRQRGGQPAGGRCVPAGPGRRRPWPGGRSKPGDHEQRAAGRGVGLGVLRDRRWRPRRASGSGWYERRAYRDDQHCQRRTPVGAGGGGAGGDSYCYD